MVHHTIKMNNTKAPSASSSSKVMVFTWEVLKRRALRGAAVAAIVGTLLSCATPLPSPTPTPKVAVPPATYPEPTQVTGVQPSTTGAAAAVHVPPVTPDTSAAWRWADAQPLPRPLQRGKSVWMPVRWHQLPGWGTDTLHDAWNAWLRSCERPAPSVGNLCAEARRLTLGSSQEQHDWMMERLQPYQVQSADGQATGLLTGYFEPVLPASRQRTATHTVALHRLPSPWRAPTPNAPWFSRQDIQTRPEAQQALAGQALAWLQDPIDALLLQIQGSGRLVVQEPDGSQRTVRLAYAGHNGHPYQSVGRWLLDRGLIREGSWEAIRAWAQQNPQRLDEMLWSNPRYVFFREEPLNELDAQFGPKGAQGVPLTPGRSIAVDRDSIPYGTPVWLHSAGPAAQISRLVLAQDTGSAIVGAVRADYFTGWGGDAYAQAAQLKQPLRLWALWPRGPSP